MPDTVLCLIVFAASLSVLRSTPHRTFSCSNLRVASAGSDCRVVSFPQYIDEGMAGHCAKTSFASERVHRRTALQFALTVFRSPPFNCSIVYAPHGEPKDLARARDCARDWAAGDRVAACFHSQKRLRWLMLVIDGGSCSAFPHPRPKKIPSYLHRSLPPRRGCIFLSYSERSLPGYHHAAGEKLSVVESESGLVLL